MKGEYSVKKKPENEGKTYYLPIFMSIGLSVGMAIGAGLGNISIGMCFGMAIGVCLNQTDFVTGYKDMGYSDRFFMCFV